MNNPLGGGLRREAEAGAVEVQTTETALDSEVVKGVVKNTNTEVDGLKQETLADVVKNTQTEMAEQVADEITGMSRPKVFSTAVENTANVSSGERGAEISGERGAEATEVLGEELTEGAELLRPEKETGVQEQEYLDEDAEDRAVEDGTGWEHDIVMQNTEKLAKTAMKVVKSEVAEMTHPADLDYKRLKWMKELLLSAYNRKYPGRAA